MKAMLSPYDDRLRALIQRLVRDAARGAAVASLVPFASACSTSSTASDASDASASAPSDAGKPLGDATTATGDGASDEPTDACSGALVPADGPSDGSGCEYYQRIACGLPASVRDHDGSLDGCLVYLGICYSWCTQYGEAVAGCSVVECDDAGNIAEGPVTIDCVSSTPQCTGTVGRRPRGLRDAPARASKDAVGAWLAECARLEAASVRAFRDLRAELASLGAPRSLVARAGESARDEVRHARVMSRLARARGATPARATATATATKSTTPTTTRAARLAELARDNAVEGCVRETFGAVVATWQSMHATDARVARAMKAIARDETRHAALAWAIASWLDGELDARSRAEVRRATSRALDALRCDVVRTDVAMARELGIPAGEPGGRLVDALAAMAAFATLDAGLGAPFTPRASARPAASRAAPSARRDSTSAPRTRRRTASRAPAAETLPPR
jgi:hypothetical protein